MIRLDYSYGRCVSRHRWLLLALFISLLLHLLLVAEFAFELPFLHEDDPETTTLHATLVQPPPAKPKVSSAPKTPPPQKKAPPHHQRSPNKIPKPMPSDEAVIASSTGPVMPIFPASDASNATTAGESTDAHSNGSGEAAVASDADQNMLKTILRRVETEFDVKRGSDSAAVGITTITYVRDDAGKYSLTSKTKAKGVASLFFGNLVQTSEGIITDQGLRPTVYTYQYGSSDKKLQRAQFNWEEGILHLHSSKGDRTVNLPADTQDFLSFMYQFMFIPPLDNMRISMTNGKKIGTYDYSFEGEEKLHTRVGELNTIHLLRSGEDDDKTELWLAIEHQYLPVKIRKTEKDGTVIEQLVTHLHTDQQ